jgi:hypothetical protein
MAAIEVGEGATDYASLPGAPRSSSASRRWALPLGIVVGLGLCLQMVMLSSSSASSSSMGVFSSLKAAPTAIVHTGEWCQGSGAAAYTKTTLKRVLDRTIAGLLTYEAVASEGTKFEASDVIRVGEEFFSVCDSSWSILRMPEQLPFLSHENRLIGPDASFAPPPKQDSGFEAIMHDASSDGGEDYYVVRESVAHEAVAGEAGAGAGGTTFDAQVLKINFHGPAYHVVEVCHSEFKFEGDSKGFEGAVSLRGADGELYLLGLCEGNYCSESRGKEVGNGRVVVMKRVDAPDEESRCLWKTVKVLELPKSVRFVDYSAFAVHHSTQAVAVTSQENSQLWVGDLSGGSDGAFDPESAVFGEGKVFDFPRTQDGCQVEYCNIEGIHWVSGAAKAADEEGDENGDGPPQRLVAVSDKMKSKGKQSAACQDKDQSVHLFMLP